MLGQLQVSTTVPAEFFRIALSPELFHTYQSSPQYRCEALLLPLPVWTVTVAPEASL